MQTEKYQKSDIFKDFTQTYNRIDYFCHVKQFKPTTKFIHIDVFSESNKNKPPDFYTQMRRLLLQMIYLYYVAYYKKVDIYVYKRYCINRWGLILKYYSLQTGFTFMQKISHEQFVQNSTQLFKEIWQFKTREQEEDENEMDKEESSKYKQDKDDKFDKKEEAYFNNWIEFAHRFYDAIGKSESQNIAPKEFLAFLQQTKHAKNNIMIIGVMASTIFPLIKFNKTIQRIHSDICLYEPYIISRIFGDHFPDQAMTQFTNSIIRFFRALSDFKVIAITSTLSENKAPIISEWESLLVEFKLNIDRASLQKEEGEKTQKMTEQQKSNINQSKPNSENDYNIQSELDKKKNDNNLGEVVCHYFWNKNKNQKELTFRVGISIDKNICPLYWRQVEEVWTKLSEKWKVILNENKQLSGFDPGFVLMKCNKESISHQVTFTEYLKYQPIQSAISELIITTDKLIIAALAMQDILCYYESKSDGGQKVREELVLNPGRIQDMAKSICQSIKNYYGSFKEVMAKVLKRKTDHDTHN